LVLRVEQAMSFLEVVEYFLENLLIGGVSASIAKTIVAPLDRIKILLQLQHTLEDLGKQKRAIEVAKYVLKEQGFLSFWRGNGTNVLRYFPTQALNFAFKDWYNSLLKPSAVELSPKKVFFYSLISGGLAGGTTEFFVYPLDFVRTRLVSDMAKKKVGKTVHWYLELYDNHMENRRRRNEPIPWFFYYSVWHHTLPCRLLWWLRHSQKNIYSRSK